MEPALSIRKSQPGPSGASLQTPSNLGNKRTPGRSAYAQYAKTSRRHRERIKRDPTSYGRGIGGKEFIGFVCSCYGWVARGQFPVLIERDEPLESLLSAARRAAAGHGSTVILGGEAGIGKTSLLRRVCPAYQRQIPGAVGRMRGPVHAAPAGSPAGHGADARSARDRAPGRRRQRLSGSFPCS